MHEHDCGCKSCKDAVNRAATSYARHMEQRCQRQKLDAEAICRDAKQWLEPLLAGGLSAARNNPIGPTAERLAESILIALDGTIRGQRFSVTDADDDFPPY